MAIVIREYLDSPMTVNDRGTTTKLQLTEGYNTVNKVAKDSIMVDIEGIHVGPTRNFTWYTEKALRSSQPTWTQPYERPLILHHNEKDGKIVGRVLNAQYTDVNTRSKTGALIFTCNVSDKDGKEGVLDGRFKTVSIGVIANDVKCSICGHSISDYGECEHERGVEYDGETCYWIIDDMEAKELSYVIVPSDIYAHNIRIYEPNEAQTQSIQEGVVKMSKTLDMTEGLDNVVTETGTSEQVIDETVISEPTDKKPEGNEEEKPKVEESDVAEKPEEKEEQDEKANAEDLQRMIRELEAVIAKLKSDLDKAHELRQAAEDELVCANTQLKEFAVDKVMALREQLGRPVVLKESLLKRSNASLMDSISDLKEEIEIAKPKTVEITEKTEDVNNITKVMSESLVDEDDSANNKDGKKSALDVKESVESSNKDYEASLNTLAKYYEL